ncbi:hypothetical protein SDC9_92344 [bioreactor metagenome]|uniref:EamA domain-containing protein n=1 Tax=bioreactor metagenome TaxID=1076179 RepID=A0A645A7D0_9ZZZZ
MTAFCIIIYFLLQIGAYLLFKWGSGAPDLYWRGFVLGNVLGITSTLLIIQIYKTMNANLATAVTMGGAFLLVQIAMIVVHRTLPGGLQIAGALLIFTGITMMSLGDGIKTTIL